MRRSGIAPQLADVCQAFGAVRCATEEAIRDVSSPVDRIDLPPTSTGLAIIHEGTPSPLTERQAAGAVQW